MAFHGLGRGLRRRAASLPGRAAAADAALLQGHGHRLAGFILKQLHYVTLYNIYIYIIYIYIIYIYT